MKNLLKVLGLSLLGLALVVPSFAFAVGSGSGGSPPVAQPQPTPPPVVEEPAPQPVAPAPRAQPVAAPVAPAPTPAPTPTVSPRANTPVIATAPVAATCNSLGIRTERIMCRLQKDPTALAQEQAQEYLPEVCRTMPAGSAERGGCIALYEGFFPCWDEPVGPGRITCAREALDIDVLAPATRYCEGQDSACITSYTQKIYRLITFRLYDLEERAEKWYEEGRLSLEETASFVDFIVESKLAFNGAGSKAERASVIDSVQAEWDSLVAGLEE